MTTTLQVMQFTECTRYCEAMMAHPTARSPVYVSVIGWGLCDVSDDNSEMSTTKTAALIYDNAGGLSTVYAFQHFVKLIFDPKDKLDVSARTKECEDHLREEQVEQLTLAATSKPNAGAN